MRALFTICTATVGLAISAATVAVGAGVAGAAVPACTSTQIVTTLGPSVGFAGNDAGTLLFRNASSRTCTLRGFPGLSAVNSKGKVILNAVRTTNAGMVPGPRSVRTVTLNPGAFANATIASLNHTGPTGATCPRPAAMMVTAPNTTHAVRVPAGGTLCGLKIYPVDGNMDGLVGYSQGQESWLHGAQAPLTQRRYFWARSITGLQISGTDWSEQIGLLRQLLSLPVTNLSHVQWTLRHQDVNALNYLFNTPNAYR